MGHHIRLHTQNLTQRVNLMPEHFKFSFHARVDLAQLMDQIAQDYSLEGVSITLKGGGKELAHWERGELIENVAQKEFEKIVQSHPDIVIQLKEAA